MRWSPERHQPRRFLLGLVRPVDGTVGASGHADALGNFPNVPINVEARRLVRFLAARSMHRRGCRFVLQGNLLFRSCERQRDVTSNPDKTAERPTTDPFPDIRLYLSVGRRRLRTARVPGPRRLTPMTARAAAIGRRGGRRRAGPSAAGESEPALRHGRRPSQAARGG